MKRFFSQVWRLLTSRRLPPLVIGIFFLVYIGIAFFTDETLMALIVFTRRSIFLAALFALIPLNSALRLVQETLRHFRRRRALNGAAVEGFPGLFDESVDVPASPVLSELEGRLAGVGYTTRSTSGTLAAWRGLGVFPARILLLAGSFCLFAGILISTTSRSVIRGMVIEGEPFPAPYGAPAIVERIRLAGGAGPILARTLTMDVVPEQPGGGSTRSFGLYPPSLYGGTFVYPRYLGIGLIVRFSAPDLPQRFEKPATLNLYPPGKEGSVAVPESPYRIDFSIAQPPTGGDRYVSYMSERMTLQIKLLKGKELLFSGSAPSGGALERDGYRIELPDVRRMVVTDFIGDYGVFCIWAAGILYVVAVLLYLPLRFFFPRREMLFRSGPDLITAYCRAEGKGFNHAGVFHDALDMLETRKPDSQSLPDDRG